MKTEKHSFLENILGESLYCAIASIAEKVVVYGGVMMLIVLALTFFVHWKFVNDILWIISGASLGYVIYVLSALIVLDFGVDVTILDEYDYNYNYDYCCENHRKRRFEKNRKYKLNIVWMSFLLLVGIASIFCTNKYRKHYAFQCETFYVDKSKGIYHVIENVSDCENVDDKSTLVKMKGFEIEEETTCTLCTDCELYLEDLEYEYSESLILR